LTTDHDHHDRLARYEAAYRGPEAPPWDTGIVPPEVIEQVGATRPGRALDVGCGTGTSSIFLAASGWRVTGVDWVELALARARRRAVEAGLPPEVVRFAQADVATPDFLVDHPPVELWLDAGCLHGLPVEAQPNYAGHAARLVRAASLLMLYCWGRYERDGVQAGLDPADVVALFRPAFDLERQQLSRDGADQTRTAGWYWLRRVPERPVR